MCLGVPPACVSMHQVNAVPREARREHVIHWNPAQVPKDQRMLLTDEPLLQSLCVCMHASVCVFFNYMLPPGKRKKDICKSPGLVPNMLHTLGENICKTFYI